MHPSRPSTDAATVPAPDPGLDDVRQGLHAMWGSVAGSWGEHAEFADARARPVTAALLRRAQLRPGHRVLELACGAGGLGLAAAARVAPGEVVLSDVAPEMVAVARSRAARGGLDNVAARALDLEAIAEPDGTFDAVLCREGLMLVLDPARAAQEILRVLRPGGRAVISVWGPRGRNPWLGAIFDAVTEELGMPMPPAGRPGPFALDDADALAGALRGGGWSAPEVEEVAVPMHVSSVDAWWRTTSALAGPLARMLAALPEGGAEAIRTRAARSIAAFAQPDGSLEIPGVCLVASCTA